jgi:hypothetical protein
MSKRGSAEVLELLSERRPAQAPAVMLGLRPHPRFRPLSRHSSRCHPPGHRSLRLDRTGPRRERLHGAGLGKGREFGLVVGRGERLASGHGGLIAENCPARHAVEDAELARIGRGGCHVSNTAGSAGASMPVSHAEAWAAAVPWRHGRGARRDSEQGRGPDAAGRGELSVQARWRTRGEGWTVAAKDRQLRRYRRAGWVSLAV